MKKCLPGFSIIFLLLFNDLVAQSTFQKIFYHTDPGFQLEDHINKLIIDSNQDFVFAGHSREVVSFTSWASLFKTNRNGSLLWYKFYEYNQSSSSARSLIEIPEGNYILTGQVHDSLGQAFTSYIMKTDTAGEIIWSKILPFSSTTIGLEDLSMSGNNIYCAGTVNNYIHGSSQDFYFVKINPDGDILWSKYLANAQTDRLNGITTTLDRGCAFVGDNGYDIYYGKLDSAGNRQWSKRIVLSGNDDGLHIEQTNDGGYLISGITSGFGFGGYDILLFKTDSMGDVLWAKVIGTQGSDLPGAIIQLRDGSLIISGACTIPNLSALSIRVDSSGNLMSSNIYGLNGGTGFSASDIGDDYFVFAGARNYLPPNGLLLPYIVKTDTAGISGCLENPHVLFDSVFALTAIDVSDTVVDGGLLLVDILMNVYDETLNIADSEFCFVNSIVDLNFDSRIQLFPNPNNGNFRVQIDGTVNGKLIIYNTVGKIVHDQIISSNNFELAVSNIASGFYIVKMIDNKSKTSTTLKLIVQH